MTHFRSSEHFSKKLIEIDCIHRGRQCLVETGIPSFAHTLYIEANVMVQSLCDAFQYLYKCIAYKEILQRSTIATII